jgi:polar amino acid transport system substrate-binding protein
MRTKRTGLLLAAAASALLLAGACSSDSTTTTDTTAGSSGSTLGALPATGTDTPGSTPGSLPATGTETPVSEIQAMVADATLITDGTLTVCSDIPYAPFEFEDDNGELTGFDVELVDAMAEQMNLETDFKTTPFSSIIPALIAGDCDVIVSATTITEDRSKQVLFSDPYFDADQSLLVTAENEGTYKSLDDLAGKSIGVQSGTTGADYAEEHKPDGATIKEFDGADALFTAIVAGDIDAVLQDFPVNAYRALQQPEQFAVTETFPTGEQYGMAVTLENTNLADALNASLGNVRVSGTYDEIYSSWFGED